MITGGKQKALGENPTSEPFHALQNLKSLGIERESPTFGLFELCHDFTFRIDLLNC
jgi:hypothetical protein